MACADDAEVAARAAREVRQPASDFVWAQLRELADLYERRCCEGKSGHEGLGHWLGSRLRRCLPQHHCWSPRSEVLTGQAWTRHTGKFSPQNPGLCVRLLRRRRPKRVIIVTAPSRYYVIAGHAPKWRPRAYCSRAVIRQQQLAATEARTVTRRRRHHEVARTW